MLFFPLLPSLQALLVLDVKIEKFALALEFYIWHKDTSSLPSLQIVTAQCCTTAHLLLLVLSNRRQSLQHPGLLVFEKSS